MDRRDTVRLFRGNLAQAMERTGLTQSALARQVGVDRSTLSQLLSQDNDRLPRADTVAAMAATLQVSLDWLLGLSHDAQLGADILEQSLQIERTDPLSSVRRLADWFEEASGYKIRYVPTTIPDLMKTDRVIEYEYVPSETVRTEDARVQAAGRLEYSRLPETDMEVCNTVQHLQDFAHGRNIWNGLDRDSRIAQLRLMIKLVEELYPTLRWFLYDGLKRYSVPVTIFGPLRAAVYVGQMYLVFNTTEHIRVLTRHFDGLIRAAVVQPPDVPAFLRGLLAELESDGAA